jgi:hypothetical protein
MTELDLEIVNVVGWISYRQELDLAVLAETFATRSEITSVTYEPAIIIGFRRISHLTIRTSHSTVLVGAQLLKSILSNISKMSLDV